MNKQSFSTNKLVTFKKFSKKANLPVNSGTSVMVDGKGVPLGFVFGRDAFISFLQHIDDEFEERVKDPRLAFNNPAGMLIDLIESKLPLNPNFVRELRRSTKKPKKEEFVSLKELSNILNV